MKNYFGQVPRLYSNSPKKWIILPLSVIAILICVAVLTSPDDRLHVYVLDVGQGDSILIQKGNSQILIDGGDISGNLARRLGDKLPFWDRTIELMVLTHPHDDHVAGLVDVLRRYDVRKVLTSGQEGDSGAYQELCNLIGEKGIEEITAQVGQRITLGEDVELAVLHPSDSMPETLTTDINDGSVVLRLEFDRFSCLLTGDIGNRVEDYLLNQAVCVRSTVLKVAHHGSPYSTSAEFLGEVAPTFAVISVGADNSFGHPAEEVVMRLDELVGAGNVLKTSEHGTIEFITDGERLLVKTAE